MPRTTRTRWLLLLALIGTAACARFVALTDKNYAQEIRPDGASEVAVLFSHNVNGETQPCGCRQFPLGGLEQAAGIHHQERARGPVIYVDTGDLFFQNSVVPAQVRDSQTYTGEVLAEALGALKLTFFVPGDQDFALGRAWLEGVSQQAPFTFLLANLRDGTGFKSRRWAEIRVGTKRLVFIGVLDPELLQAGDAALFSSPEVAIGEALNEARPRTGDVIILLSHSGMERDRRYAQLHPRLDWVIGAHSQSYTTRPAEQGTTKLVQVLSRNHFIGRVGIALGAKDASSSWALLETREETSKLVDPNPLTPLLQRWRTESARRQELEQKATAENAPADPLPTFNSCTDCHKPQVAFWQGTAHALAWQTLTAKGADNDPSCVGCHSLGWQHPQGFSRTPERALFAGKPEPEKFAAYTRALATAVGHVKSPRAMAANQRRPLAQKWQKEIEGHAVSHEFGNVQCVHCHDKTRDHPFDGSTAATGEMASRCFTCHTADQSPAWYKNGAPDMNVVRRHVRAVACPKK
jgi:hypothetical protein